LIDFNENKNDDKKKKNDNLQTLFLFFLKILKRNKEKIKKSKNRFFKKV